MRRGKEFYTEKIEKAKRLYSEGREIKDIAKELNVSYSAVYHWVKGLRTPKKSRLEEFRDFLKENGPTPVARIEKEFPKHNELYNISSTRGIEIRRIVIEKNFRGGKNYGTWYFLPGQEKELLKRIEKLLENYRLARKVVLELLENLHLG